MQKSKKFLYLAFLMSSLSSWRVKSSWLNSQSSRVTSSWKYAQFDLSQVENVSNSTSNWVEFKMSIQQSVNLYVTSIKMQFSLKEI